MTRAPELVGDAWFGIEADAMSIADFRGRFLLLDFWTLCCVNCHHVLAELRPLEKKFSDALTVVGVHSPKFEHEKNPESVAAAMERHDIHHPVLNDPNMATWSSYNVRAWPTLVLVDPNGKIVSTYSGEGHSHAIEALLSELIPKYEAAGDLVRGTGVFVAPERSDSMLRQPGKIQVIPDRFRSYFKGADLLVSNSGGHNLVAINSSDPDIALVKIGAGTRGFTNGPLTEAQFAEPYGLRFLPAELAAQLGYELVVADTANHAIRAISFTNDSVITIAGTGQQWMQQEATDGIGIDVNISTPWDVELIGDELLIGMAGEHRIWKLNLVSDVITVYAGTTNEGLVDGAVTQAWFAQPSAIVRSEVQPGKIWVIDAETSALRVIEKDSITTLVGQGLFDFGHVDGSAEIALMQHPLGLTELPDGNLLIADPYNKAVRRYSPATNQMTTLRRGLAEPSDVALIQTEAGARLAIVEAAANRVSIVAIEDSVLVAGAAMRTSRPALEVSPGASRLEISFTPPPGQKLDERFGPSTHLVVSSTPREFLVSGAGSGPELKRDIELNPMITEGVLHVAAKGASCDVVTDEEVGAACHIHQQDWGIPIKLVAGATSVIALGLSGVN
jgi:thiol-disulfide isomerase/thioredoxin